MFWTKLNESTRTLLYSGTVVTLAAVALFYGATFNKADAISNSGMVVVPAATFAPDAGTLGPIPDSAGGPQSPGAPRNVTFTVSGLSGAPSNVEVSMTFGSPIHTWVGDLVATLIAPNGASFVLFGNTGATSAASFGDSSNLTGPYNFKDSAAAPPSGGWWQNASANGDLISLTAGDYRSTAPGPTTNPAPATTISPAFSGVANPNGTWTLRFTDGASGDTGSVSAATLTVTSGMVVTPTQHVVDYDGNGRTDFSVVRNTGGGSGGQVTWYNLLNGPGTVSGFQWGISTDFFVPEDYDGDNKTDIAVWRPGAATVAAFYILQSSTNTARVELFGQTGDDPTVVGDYDGDGKTDLAVYREGATTGAQSVWYYRGSLNNPGGNVTFIPWGVNGDFPAPGDYDGDGKNDFNIQRNGGNGQGVFWLAKSTGGTTVTYFGQPTDVIVPGDYDADGKTDIATVRGIGGIIHWYYLSSLNGSINETLWGNSATDFPTQGDYDGDGKTDAAIWRPNADPNLNFFYVLQSSNGTLATAEWGQNGDYPVANFNTH